MCCSPTKLFSLLYDPCSRQTSSFHRGSLHRTPLTKSLNFLLHSSQVHQLVGTDFGTSCRLGDICAISFPTTLFIFSPVSVPSTPLANLRQSVHTSPLSPLPSALPLRRLLSWIPPHAIRQLLYIILLWEMSHWCRRVSVFSTLCASTLFSQSCHVDLLRSVPRLHQQSLSVDFAPWCCAGQHIKLLIVSQHGLCFSAHMYTTIH